MTAALYDEVVTATQTPKLRVVPQPTAAPKHVSKQSDRLFAGDPLVEGAARLLSIPLRQLYAALWRAGVLEISS